MLLRRGNRHPHQSLDRRPDSHNKRNDVISGEHREYTQAGDLKVQDGAVRFPAVAALMWRGHPWPPCRDSSPHT